MDGFAGEGGVRGVVEHAGEAEEVGGGDVVWGWLGGVHALFEAEEEVGWGWVWDGEEAGWGLVVVVEEQGDLGVCLRGFV